MEARPLVQAWQILQDLLKTRDVYALVVFLFFKLQVLLESYKFLLAQKYSVLVNFSGQNTFSKTVAIIIWEGQIRLEVDKTIFTI